MSVKLTVVLMGLVAMSLIACVSRMTAEDADLVVESLMASQEYRDILEGDELVDAFTNAMMEHPSMQTTPKEDCVTAVVMAVVMAGSESGEYTPPPDDAVDRLCEWYEEQTE